MITSRTMMAGCLTSLFILLLLTCAHCVDECPDTCECMPEGRGILVSCQAAGMGSDLLSIISSLPHNAIYLRIQGMTTLQTLTQTDLGQRQLSLIKLSITQSSLQLIEGLAFQSLKTLQNLDLSQNNIRSLAVDTFTGLSNLYFLNLSNNRIAQLESTLEPLVSLRDLDISNNDITDLPPSALRAQSSLTSLRLDGNQLRSLQGKALTTLTLLTHLRVRKCNLFEVSHDVFEAIPRITVLDLGDNRLSSFPSSVAFSKLQQLRDLYLDQNELLKLHPSQFADLNLHTLSLSRNRLIEIGDDALRGLNVEDLDLSENKLQYLSPTALKLVAGLLTKLNLAYNPIRNFDPDTFSGLGQLKSLNISACSLHFLNAETFRNVYSLQRLDLSWNSLQNVTEDMIDIFNRVSKINLQQNNWLCDCHIRPLRDWLRSAKSLQKLFCIPGRYGENCSSLRCNSPENLAGRRVSLLDTSELMNCGVGAAQAGLPMTTQIGIVMGCLVFSLSVLIIVLYLWRRGRTRKGLKKIIFKRRKRDSHEEDDDDEKIDPLEGCDDASLKESHRSFVFRHYFDTLVTDPMLLSRPSVSHPPSEGQLQGQRDSMYSSNPSLYETSHNSRSIVVGMESAV